MDYKCISEYVSTRYLNQMLLLGNLVTLRKQVKKQVQQGDFIKGMNPETNAVEHVFSRTLLKAATRDENGVYTNENGWSHTEIDEYVSADNLYQSDADVTVNTETGEIISALPSLS